MTRPYTLSVGGHETKLLYEERNEKSMKIRGRHAKLQKKLQAAVDALMDEPLMPKGKRKR